MARPSLLAVSPYDLKNNMMQRNWKKVILGSLRSGSAHFFFFFYMVGERAAGLGDE